MVVITIGTAGIMVIAGIAGTMAIAGIIGAIGDDKSFSVSYQTSA
jgi:hypothetical protein